VSAGLGRKWIYLGTGAIGLIVLLLLVRIWSPRQTPGAPPARPVSVAEVITKDVPLYLDEIGTCTAFESVQVQAQVAGQIVERHFKDGADVKKGDLLFTIDKRPYQAALDAAKSRQHIGPGKSKTAIGITSQGRHRDSGPRHGKGERHADAGGGGRGASESRLLLHSLAD
jgi:multidrug efflux pump subunit AcrA (membrane-fusion protein)